MKRTGVVSRVAPAKLNLTLRVLAREESGYHQIETLFCALELADQVDVGLLEEGVQLDVHAEGAGSVDLGPVESNLAARAARAFVEQRGGGARIRLTKRIPAGAGLGGGSSDAAAVLRALNGLHDRPLPAQELLELGGTLGADVPFFLSGAPLALAWGRGDRLLPLPALPPAHVLLAVPTERVATAAAYQELARAGRRTTHPALLAAPRSWSDVAAAAVNDFESVVFRTHPRLAALRELLRTHGAQIARMTGSGSVVFGVFGDRNAAEQAADMIAGEHDGVQLIHTSTAAGALDA